VQAGVSFLCNFRCLVSVMEVHFVFLVTVNVNKVVKVYRWTVLFGVPHYPNIHHFRSHVKVKYGFVLLNL